MQPQRNHRDEAGASPPPSTATPDIIIPPPAGSAPHADHTPLMQVPDRPASVVAPSAPISSTTLVVVAVLVLLWAGLLVFVRRLLVQSLVTQFADLSRARGAGTTLYLFLLVLGATLAVCTAGDYWQRPEIAVPAGVLSAVMLVLSLASYASARSSRQRR